jgi:hypothetical protein
MQTSMLFHAYNIFCLRMNEKGGVNVRHKSCTNHNMAIAWVGKVGVRKIGFHNSTCWKLMGNRWKTTRLHKS